MYLTTVVLPLVLGIVGAGFYDFFLAERIEKMRSKQALVVKGKRADKLQADLEEISGYHQDHSRLILKFIAETSRRNLIFGLFGGIVALGFGVFITGMVLSQILNEAFLVVTNLGRFIFTLGLIGMVVIAMRAALLERKVLQTLQFEEYQAGVEKRLSELDQE